ncbi:hypothetical protein BB560_004775 [Smittium megazygosporum]|uniref:Trehalose-phosphatase n=1 Tax=Smittium megazygosporum TaxID=133381 RepID=A0A2T9Z8A6_9FUNG|nr:hypothetical protein BB560_004775 [Smittium megazygosporum]
MTKPTESDPFPTDKVISVSHYLPLYAVATTETEPIQWTFEARRGHTALYSGISALYSLRRKLDIDVIYVGAIGKYRGYDGKEYSSSELSEESKLSLASALWAHRNQVPIFLDETLSFDFYEGYCKQVLWPLMHYLSWEDSKTQKPEWWDAYQSVNKLFADTILRYCNKNAQIWINDYHLLTLPEFIKGENKDPQRSMILKGMLNSDVIGFQLFSYSRHFSSSCTRVLGLESTSISINYKGNEVQLETIPIGIDVDSLMAKMASPSVLSHEKAFLEAFKDKKIVIGRDKLDTANGIMLKLEAFELFLERYPEWRNKICLIQVTQSENSLVSKLDSKISEKVTSINSKYGSLSSSPIHYHHSYLEYDVYVALLKVADLGLITSVRDGMNTGALEYIVCQKEKHSPLLLSEFAGTAGSACGAIKINPWDTKGVADQIYYALTLSETEKARRHKMMFKQACSHNSASWASTFINCIRKNAIVTRLWDFVPSMDESIVIDSYRRSKKRLLLFDYDGTLVPITNIPSEAVIPKASFESLERLSEDPKNEVWVISGRDVKFLDSQLGSIKQLGLSAEHGGFIRYPKTEWESLIHQLDLSWKPMIREIFEFFTERTNGSTIEEKDAAITWHYRNADPEYGDFQCRQCMNHLESVIASSLPVELLIGKKCLEVRPKEVNKGEIVSRLLGPSLINVHDFVFVAGDDRTDEDMFKAVRAFSNTLMTFNLSSNNLSAMRNYQGNIPFELFESSTTDSEENGTMVDEMSSASSLYRSSLDPYVSHIRRTECFSVYVGSSNRRTGALWTVSSPAEIINIINGLVNSSSPKL